ncbi:hypothetical protein EDEG_02785 [Edhazardia aedis USNM 41457]|uniref:NUC153 domain-containing protein n=1 Tax=Edhazardia aedis (strain USNM 41457) TaxID=1003232 RepID=J9D5M2_EDHAE|nr:hypothetical protein EDEG_02785 [Edhazardia aedis USNM 41457]|eukprot:EJW02844.1 hypothetical protein EDEG_02785 [Edhazardia aedis USNM 41457]
MKENDIGWEGGSKRDRFIDKLFEQEEYDINTAENLIDLSDEFDENGNYIKRRKRKDKKAKKKDNESDKRKGKKSKNSNIDEKKNITDKLKIKTAETDFADIISDKEIVNPDINIADKRFEKLFTDKEFAIDVSSKKFKTDKSLRDIMKERRNRKQQNTDTK